MGHLHNVKNQNTSFLSSFGEKVKHVAAAAATAKGIYDTGRTIYQIAQAAIPIIETAIPMIEAAMA